MLRIILNNKLSFWALLAIPAVFMLVGYFNNAMPAIDLLHPTGEWSARMMVLAMMISPLMSETNDYERMVFTGQIDYHTFGISLPDLVGYEGGQPITLRDGTKLAVGFSGFRGGSDLEIVERAVEKENRVSG